jgi:hypothetical protein
VYALGGQVFRWTGEKSIRHAEQAELPYLPRIAGVDYWGQRISAAHIEPLVNLPKLRSICFWGCTFDPRALEQLDKCDSPRINLSFRLCAGCDEAFLGAGPLRVGQLSFDRCDVSAIGLQRLTLPDTVSVFADNVSRLGDTALAAIRLKCPNLRSLDVRGCPITNAGCSEIARMPRLERLMLTGSPAVTNIGWHTLANNPSLKEANLYGTGVSVDEATADGKWQEGYGQFTLERVVGGPNQDD